MVPSAALRMARNTCRYPLALRVIPNVPLASARNTTFMPEDETHPPEELIDVELQSLRHTEIVSIEIHIVGKVVDRGDDGLIAVVHPLGRVLSDQMVVPKGVGVWRATSHPINRRVPAE